MTDKEKLVLRVNEIFHDIEGTEYQKKHDDIFTGEAQRWQNVAKKYFSEYNSPLTVLDVGTGTGFIPLNTANFLSIKDLFICSDISQEMLNVSKIILDDKKFQCRFEYLKLSGNKINVNEKNISLITINSVLHHIPNPDIFFTKLNAILSPGGRIIIGHEPNKQFYRQKFLLNLYLFLQSISSFKKFAISIVRLTHIDFIYKKFITKSSENNRITNKINQILIDEGSILKKLTIDEINKMIDYHSPSAGSKMDKSKGIDIEDIRKKYLPGFETEYYETYNFISKMSNRNALMKKLNNSLSKKYEGKGATFFVVLKKIK